MSARLKPIIYVAFANPTDIPALALRGLPDEEANIKDALKDATQEDSSWEYEEGLNSTRAGLVEVFYSNRVAVFHYGGHADPQHLFLPAETASRQLSNAVLLEDFLSLQQSLKFAFFNACSTREWAENLVRLGVPCVIATSRPVRDEMALKFASAFYRCMAHGASIAEAFKSAKSSLGFTEDGNPQPNDGGGAHRSIDEADEAMPASNDFPWAIYWRMAADADWTLNIGANDPLIGLPVLDVKKYPPPNSPYVTIKGHTPGDALIFFGRNAEIRSLYDWVVRSPGEPPILLFYGQSGVGKSALLNAGLLPRLNGEPDVVALRRNLNLTEDLHEAIGGASDDTAKAWLASENPKLIILDQIEEAITHNEGSTTELHAFIARLVEIFSMRPPNSKARLILSFRKEYLAEIRNALTAGTPEGGPPLVKDFWLERLDFQAVKQVVAGPTLSRPLREKYKITLADEDLPAAIANDLEDRNSPIATILQIILNQLWKAATKDGGDPVYSLHLYKSLTDTDNPLQGFFDERLKELESDMGGLINNEGLELDLLYEHTTQLVTSKRVLLSDLKKAYPQVPNLERLIARNKELYLLTEPVQEAGGTATEPQVSVPATSLTHDTLAPIIRREFELSLLRGSRARRLLENRARDWAPGKTGDPLDATDLRLVEKGQDQMRTMTADEKRLVAASKQRRLRLMGYAAAILFVVVAIAGGIAWRQRNLRLAAERTSLSNRLGGLAAGAMSQQYDLAVLLSVAALRADDTFASRNAAISLFETMPGVITYLHPEVGSTFSTGDLAYSPDYKWLAASNANRVELWDVASNHRIWSTAASDQADEFVSKLAFSPDNRTMAIVESSRIQLWQASDHKVLVEKLAGLPKGDLETVAFSPDGRLLASAGCDGIQVWSLKDNRPLRDLSQTASGCQREDQISTIAFDPADATKLAAMWFHGEVTFEDAITGSNIGKIPTFGGQRGLAFSADGRKLAVGAAGGSIEILNLGTHTTTGQISAADKRPLVAFAFSSPDGNAIAAATGHGGIGVWNATTGAELQPLSKDQGYTSFGTAFSPSLFNVAIKADHGDVILFDTTRMFGTPLRSGGQGPQAPVVSVAFSPDGRWLAGGGADGGVSIWDMKSKAFYWGFQMAGNPDDWLQVSTLAFSSDSKLLLFPEPGRVFTPQLGLRVVDIMGRRFLPDLTDKPIHGDFATEAVAFSPDGELASVSNMGVMRFWNPAKTSPTGVLAGENTGIQGLAFSPDGKYLAGSSAAGESFGLWDLQTRKLVNPAWDVKGFAATSLAFAPAGTRGSSLLAEADSYGLSLWDIVARQRLGGSAVGTMKGIQNISFSTDGKLLGISFDDGGIQLWEIASGQSIGKYLSKEEQTGGLPPGGIAFSPDGKLLAAGGRNGSVLIWDWDMDLKTWQTRGCAIANRNLTVTERNLYFRGARYEPICPGITGSDGEGVSASAQ